VKHWLSKGAQPSDTVALLLKQPNVLAPAAEATPAKTPAK
jgi:ribosomal protein S16